MPIIILILLQFNCLGTYKPNPPKEFVDIRDGEIYEIVKIGTQEWFGVDLKYQTPESFCYDNNAENCNLYGRFYNFLEAKTACPIGWRLPTEGDWQKLEKEFGMKEGQLDSTRIWRGSDEGELIVKELGIKFSGMGKSKGSKFLGKDQLVYYWVDKIGQSGKQFSQYRMFSKSQNEIYVDQTPKMNLCCVRCIKN